MLVVPITAITLFLIATLIHIYKSDKSDIQNLKKQVSTMQSDLVKQAIEQAELKTKQDFMLQKHR